MELVRKEGLDDMIVLVGGVIPVKDIADLKEIGVTGVFPGGTPFEESIKFIREHVRSE